MIDTIMGIPHILLLLLISYALGKGVKGVVVGVALSHWPSLARVIRAEVLQLKNSTYIQVAEKLGHSKDQNGIKTYDTAYLSTVFSRTDPDVSTCDLT